MSVRVVSSADVDETARIGEGSAIWHFAQVRDGAVLGDNCIVGRGAYIGSGVRVGNNCKVQNYALVYEPATLSDGVFIGPAAVLTNDAYPRAVTDDGALKSPHDWEPVGVDIGEGASIGARAVCVAPVRIGAWAMVAAGAVVTRDVADFALVAGVPARRIGWVGRAGKRLEACGEGQWVCPKTGRVYQENDGALDALNTDTRAAFIPPAKPIIGEDERAAVDRVLRSGMLAQGPEVAAFEQEFAEHFQLGRACVAVNSGTSGLHIGLLASGVSTGDEVIVPSFTFAATANSVGLTGATPVFADIDPQTFCLDPESVQQAITDRTVGIMPVHLYGHPANMTAITTLAKRHGLKVFEDAAQAHGASWAGTPVGAFGDFGMFSLYPTKNMTSGEGGMVSVVDSALERLVRLYRNQGMQRQYQNEVVGLNNRMTDVHAAIGRVQLTKVDAWTKQRQHNADFLSANLDGVTPPQVVAGAVHVYHQYTVRVSDDRDGLAAALKDEYAVGSGMFYPVPNHRLAPFRATADLPVTEMAARECLSLPVHPSLTVNDLERIVSAVNKLAQAGG